MIETTNHARQLTDDQRPLLERRIRSMRWMGFGICITFVGLAALLTVGMLSEPGGGDLLAVIIGADVVIVLLTLPVIWRMRRDIRKVRADLAEGGVLSVSGVPRFGHKAATLIIGGIVFPPPPSDMLRDIDWQATYTAYYTPHARVIVALEKQEKH